MKRHRKRWDDPILGPVRWCNRCGEEWPIKPEPVEDTLVRFWYPSATSNCIACCIEMMAAYRARRAALGALRGTETPVAASCGSRQLRASPVAARGIGET